MILVVRIARLWSRTTKQASCCSTDHGGGKRRGSIIAFPAPPPPCRPALDLSTSFQTCRRRHSTRRLIGSNFGAHRGARSAQNAPLHVAAMSHRNSAALVFSLSLHFF